MNKIKIRKSPSADTRSADHIVTRAELELSTRMHREDVARALSSFAAACFRAGMHHDWTKVEYLDEFYDQFSNAQKTGDWGTGWFDQIHILKERHHLNDHVPEDVDLIDVLEMIADCVMAGMARTGKVYPLTIDPEVLQKAFQNTAAKLAANVEVE